MMSIDRIVSENALGSIVLSVAEVGCLAILKELRANATPLPRNVL